jgi:hypothetical protein
VVGEEASDLRIKRIASPRKKLYPPSPLHVIFENIGVSKFFLQNPFSKGLGYQNL